MKFQPCCRGMAISIFQNLQSRENLVNEVNLSIFIKSKKTVHLEKALPMIDYRCVFYFLTTPFVNSCPEISARLEMFAWNQHLRCQVKKLLTRITVNALSIKRGLSRVMLSCWSYGRARGERKWLRRSGKDKLKQCVWKRHDGKDTGLIKVWQL